MSEPTPTVTVTAYRVARELFHKACVPPGEHATRVTVLPQRCAGCDQPLLQAGPRDAS